MGLEVVTGIASLDATWPLPGDKGEKGDDHIRNIKKALKFTFPGAGGAGFTGVIAATEAELNRLVGVTNPIQTQLDTIAANLATANAKLIPATTRMLFAQAAPPSGWTLVTAGDVNSRMIRVVTSGGGSTGGSDSPILNNKVPSHNHVATSVVTDPGHRHTSANGAFAGTDPGGNVGYASFSNAASPNTKVAVTGITVATSIAANPGATNWVPRYLDVIMCSKN